MLIHLLDPLDTDRQSSDLDKKMLPCIVKQSNEYLYRIMPFWRRYCLCVWMAWGALRTQENGSLRALNFKFSWGSMPPNPPSLVGANHSCKILDPPLRYSWCGNPISVWSTFQEHTWSLEQLHCNKVFRNRKGTKFVRYETLDELRQARVRTPKNNSTSFSDLKVRLYTIKVPQGHWWSWCRVRPISTVSVRCSFFFLS